MDEYSEDLGGPSLPIWAEAYMAEQRTFWRTLGTGGVLSEEQQSEALRRHLEL